MPDLKQKLKENYYLVLILGLGLVLKLVYLFFIGPNIFTREFLVTGDSYSYTNSLINLVKIGVYTHTPGYEPASYGRLPGLPFIWGPFYLIFGFERSFWAFAVFQILLDVLAGWFVFLIIKKFFSDKVALATCFAYSFFPLTWYYITKTETEYLKLFITIVVLYQLIFFKPETKRAFFLGLTLAIGFFIRETLLLLVLLSLFYLHRHYAFSLKNFLVGVLVFLIVYLPWPIRNFVNHNVFMPVKELSAGYPSYNDDMLAFMYWMYAWHDSDIMDYFNASYKDEVNVKFPEEIFNSAAEKDLAYKLILLSRRCGSSFVDWKKRTGEKVPERECNQNTLITNGFKLLKENYTAAHPFQYYVAVPAQNIKKAIFKNSLTVNNERISLYYKLLMTLRTCMIIAGVIACFIFWKQDFFKLLFYIFGLNLFFFCFILRQIEMRYLFLGDIMLLIAACCLIFGKMFRTRDASSTQ